MSTNEEKCLIWGTPAKYETTSDYRNLAAINSPRSGGRYVIAHMAEVNLRILDDQERAKLTTWIVDQNRLGNVPANITIEIIERARSERDLHILERRDRLMQYLARRIQRIGQNVLIAGTVTEEFKHDNWAMLAWTESIDSSEVAYLIDICAEEGLIEKPGNGASIRLSAKGYQYLDQLDQSPLGATQAFVAMWFDGGMAQAYENGFARAITDAGYKPLRIDRKEHINKIDDEIIAEIRRSRFLIADFTSEPGKPRGGVYFEAGFAYGLRIPVIWTCHEDVIGNIHFDTRQFNHIVWADEDDLYIKLKNRIGAVIGDGPLKAQG